MRESSKKNMPDIMEAIFDAGYLIFDLIAGILFFVFSKGNPLFLQSIMLCLQLIYLYFNFTHLFFLSPHKHHQIYNYK